MSKAVKSTINYFAIVLMLALGVLGMILPIMPGMIFFFAAIVILSSEFPAIDDWVERNIEKIPRYNTELRKAKVFVKRYSDWEFKK